MKMFRNFLIISLCALGAPFFTYAQSFNLGIIDGIWFAEDYYAAGDTIRIYTAMQNHSGSDVTGVVNFFDNETLVGSREFSALDDRIVELWVDTVAQEGSHSFSVSVESVKGSEPGGETLDITPRTMTVEQDIVIKIDTDRDQIPDEEDLDDDNDGFSDEVEEQEGTNPKDSSSRPKEKKSDDVKLSDDIENEGIFVGLPSSAVSLREKVPFVEKPIEAISRFQNSALEKTQNERQRRVELILNSQQEDPENSLKENFYDKFLGLAERVFSCFWCTLGVLLVAIWVAFKVLFKIVRRR